MTPDPNAPAQNLSGMTAMLREAREAPEVVARLIERNAPLCREVRARACRPHTGHAPPPRSLAGAAGRRRGAGEAPEVVARLIERNAPLCRELGARLRASQPPFAVTCARGRSDTAGHL